jgi:fused signal recognition particle receptor
LRREVLEILRPYEAPLAIEGKQDGPFVVMVIGVNGVGKTTTIGKLAYRFTSQGKKVVVAAADTFRAAAIEQLEIWSERAGAHFVKHDSGSDPAAVAFDAIKAAQTKSYDLLFIDTAGRLHTKENLMEELKRVKRIVSRELPAAPHEILLVLDATTGQNAIVQARTFHEALGITGIALAKLDGTAKGGIIIAIAQELGIPLRLVGVGEGIEDLQDFLAEDFVDALFSRTN